MTDGFAKDREIILFNNAGLQPSRRHCWRVVRSSWFVWLLWAPGLVFRDSDPPRRRVLLRSRGDTR